MDARSGSSIKLVRLSLAKILSGLMLAGYADLRTELQKSFAWVLFETNVVTLFTHVIYKCF